MKFKAFLVAAMAAIVSLAGCQKAQEDLGDPEINISEKTLSFGQDGGSATITLNSTRSWKVKDLSADWVAVSPEKGDASSADQTVTISVLANDGKDRKVSVEFTCGIESAYLTISQEGPGGSIKEGDGTLANPYSASQAHDVALALASGATSDSKVYVRGIIHKIASGHESAVSQYGNGLFYISDDGESSDTDFYCFQVYYLGGVKFTSADQVKVGDDVIVYGQITNYGGNTAETVGKGAAYIYSLNGETSGDNPSGGDEDYSNAEAKTVADFINAANTTTYYKLTGTVSGFNATYCSMDLTDDTGSIYVYSVDNKADWSDKISNGGTVTLAGKYAYYDAKSQHEVVNAYILSFEEGEVVTPTDIVDVTCAEFLAAEVSTSVWYRITGTVSGNINTTYGNYDVVDETGTVYVYGTSNWTEFKSGFAKGGTVTVVGNRAEFNGEPEMKNGYIESYVPGEGGGEEGDEEIEGDNLIVNGGFEEWEDGKPVSWANLAASNATIEQSTDAHSGTYSIKTTGATSANKRLHSDAYSLKAGTYQFKVYTKGEGMFRLGYGPIKEDGTCDTGKLSYMTDAADAGSDWTKTVAQFTLTADTTISLIVMNSKNGSGKEVFVDDVELVTSDGEIL